MNLRAFNTSLQQHPEKPIRIVLPDGNRVPAHFHVTEVGHVTRRFIDCGGTVRFDERCLLQVWVPDGGTDHQLNAGKLARILDLSRRVVPSDDLETEIEYDSGVVGQYTVEKVALHGDALVLILGHKQTDCLARESCGVESAEPALACCGGKGCGCS
jgi:hypothetical protein